MKSMDLSGRKFGEWTAIAKDPTPAKNKKWICRCSCGKERAVFQFHLLSGASKACDATGAHGFKGTSNPDYRTWSNMKDRCSRKNNAFYDRYGGRGIKVCERWRVSFRAFLEDMGPRPDGMTLDRIDNNGDYEPSNCRWATRKEQANNTSSNRLLVENGKVLTIAQYASVNGIPYGTLYSRVTRENSRYGYVLA